MSEQTPKPEGNQPSKWVPVVSRSQHKLVQTRASLGMSRETIGPEGEKRSSVGSSNSIALSPPPSLATPPPLSTASPSLVPLPSHAPGSETPPDRDTLMRPAMDRGHRRSRSAGSMKAITGGVGVGPAQSRDLSNSKKDIGKTQPRPLVKQKSTVGRLFNAAAKLKGGILSDDSSGDLLQQPEVELQLNIAFADGKKKHVLVKVTSGMAVRDVLEAFLSKSASKTKKFLALKGLSAQEMLGMFVPGQVYMKNSATISTYLQTDGTPLDLYLVDTAPLSAPANVTAKLLIPGWERALFVDLEEKDLVGKAVVKCIEALGEDAAGASPATHQLYFRTSVSNEKGFWLDSGVVLGEYGLLNGCELQLRESDFVVLVNMRGERFVLDGSSTGESFLRALLARINVVKSSNYYSLFREMSSPEDLVELPTWQTVAHMGFEEKQMIHLCKVEEEDNTPVSVLPIFVESVALADRKIVLDRTHQQQHHQAGAPQDVELVTSPALSAADKRDWHGFFKLYDHEDILCKVEGVELGAHTGSLCVTNAGIVFKSERSYLRVFHGMLSRVEKGALRRVQKKKGQKGSALSEGTVLTVYCKDFFWATFSVPKSAPKNLFETILMLAFPKQVEQLYAFTYHLPPSVVPSPLAPDGWKFYDEVAFHERMGVGIAGSEWVLHDVNSDYSVCDTYPAKLAFPARCSSETLRNSASFRSRGRLPALSYLHKNGSSITRCSQPKVGLIGGSSGGDQILLQAILEANPNKDQPVLHLIDARPKLNAIANQAMGKGSERVVHYTFECTLEFANIDNIHVMRQSLVKLLEALRASISGEVDWSGYQNLLNASGWLGHLYRVLCAGVKVARYVGLDRQSVVLHCSDGWDRTAQLSSLAMVQLNPVFRTIRGFCELIEKEWLSFGHQFARRHGHAEGKMDQDGDSQRSPVFLQFLDCVWQLTNLYPCAFEFNGNFLSTVIEEVYNCRFGTFLCDCERERRELGVQTKTVSLWTYILSPSVIDLYRNPLYKASQDPLLNEIPPHLIQPWQDYYARAINRTREFSDEGSPVHSDYIVSAEARAREMSMRIEVLETQLKAKK